MVGNFSHKEDRRYCEQYVVDLYLGTLPYKLCAQLEQSPKSAHLLFVLFPDQEIQSVDRNQ